MYSTARQTKHLILVKYTLISMVVGLLFLFNQSILYPQVKTGKVVLDKKSQKKEAVHKRDAFIYLGQLIQEAKKNNPYIKSAYQTYLAAEERITQAISLEDPRASFGYFVENVETRVGPQSWRYGISQKFPFFGKLTLRGRVAQREKDIAYQNYEAVEREVIKELKKTYFELYWVRKSIDITEEIKKLLEALEGVAESRYSTGIASQQDVLKAQVEISKLMDRLLVLDQQRVSLTERLNTLLNRPVETPLDEIADFEPTSFDYSLEALFELAKENRQELKVSSLQIKKYEAMRLLKKKDYFPDFTLGVDFVDISSGHTAMPNDGQDAWVATAKINLPIWRSRIKAGVKEVEDELKASQKVYQDVENQVLFQIKDFHFRLKTARDLIDLYKSSLIPQADESFRAAMASYETGKTDFLNIIDSERVLLNFKIAYFKAVSDYEKLIADLERAVGKEFNRDIIQER